MFDNIENKVCGLAKFVAGVGIFAVIIGIICSFVGIEDEGMLYIGLLLVACGVSAILGSWPLYAIGQIAGDISSIKYGIFKKSESYINRNKEITKNKSAVPETSAYEKAKKQAESVSFFNDKFEL